jgi:thiol-disulfide isomerase/thioredoxin
MLNLTITRKRDILRKNDSYDDKEFVMNKIFGTLLVLTLAIFANDAPKIGEAAPNFQGTTFDGKKIELTDFRGKVVLIDFWASWCGPCRKEMPVLIDLYRYYRKSPFEIVAVNIDDRIDNAQKFMDQLPESIPFTVVQDSKQQIPPKYKIKGMPSSILLDKKGIIRFWHTGFKESYEDDYMSEIAELLKE